MKHKFKFYCDAGHGWLAVKRKFLSELGILSKISRFSYERGKTVYLEEDADASTFIKKLKSEGINYEIVEPSKWPDRSPIRSYDCFKLKEQEVSS